MVVLMSNQVFRSGYFVLTSNKHEKPEDTQHCLAEIEKRQGGPLPSLGERPALAQLITATDVDEAAEEEEEDAAEPSSDKSAPADSAANGDDEPADDQHQVNSEAPATRLVNVERPPCRRPRASITSIISSSNTFLSLSLQSFAPNIWNLAALRI